MFDVVVLVDAPRDVRRERLKTKRGLSAMDAERMIEAQLPSEPKRARADYVLDNAGSVAELIARADELWSELLRRASSSS